MYEGFSANLLIHWINNKFVGQEKKHWAESGRPECVQERALGWGAAHPWALARSVEQEAGAGGASWAEARPAQARAVERGAVNARASELLLS